MAPQDPGERSKQGDPHINPGKARAAIRRIRKDQLFCLGPANAARAGPLQFRERMGGLLRFYYGEAG